MLEVRFLLQWRSVQESLIDAPAAAVRDIPGASASFFQVATREALRREHSATRSDSTHNASQYAAE
jgi:hypothetical protein